MHHPAPMIQAQRNLELVQQLADQQDVDDPFSSWRDVALHAHLAAAHVERAAGRAPADALTDAPSTTAAGPDTEADQHGDAADRSRSALTATADLLDTGTFGAGPDQDLRDARLALGRALSYLPTVTPPQGRS